MDKKKEMGKVLEFKPRSHRKVNSNRNARAIPKEKIRGKEKSNSSTFNKNGVLSKGHQKNIAYFLLLCFALYVFKKIL